MSASAETFRIAAASAARYGWIARHGIRCVPSGARPLVRDGRLSLVQARVGAAWDSVNRRKNTATLRSTADDLGICLGSAARVLALLIEMELIAKDERVRPARFAVKGPRPAWRLLAAEET